MQLKVVFSDVNGSITMLRCLDSKISNFYNRDLAHNTIRKGALEGVETRVAQH